MNRILLAVALFALCFALPAHAQTKVSDWTIEKRAKDTHCNASRAYKDADDNSIEFKTPAPARRWPH